MLSPSELSSLTAVHTDWLSEENKSTILAKHHRSRPRRTKGETTTCCTARTCHATCIRTVHCGTVLRTNSPSTLCSTNLSLLFFFSSLFFLIFFRSSLYFLFWCLTPTSPAQFRLIVTSLLGPFHRGGKQLPLSPALNYTVMSHICAAFLFHHTSHPFFFCSSSPLSPLSFPYPITLLLPHHTEPHDPHEQPDTSLRPSPLILEAFAGGFIRCV